MATLKEVLQDHIGDGIREAQVVFRQKDPKSSYNAAIHNRLKNELRDLEHSLPANISSEADIQSICIFLDNIPGQIPDPRCAAAMKRVIRDSRIAFLKAIRKSNGGNKGNGSQATSSSQNPPEKEEKQEKINAEQYSNLIKLRILGTQSYVRKFFQLLCEKAQAVELPLSPGTLDERRARLQKYLAVLLEKISQHILEKNPFPSESAETHHVLEIPWGALIDDLTEQLPFLSEILPFNLDQQDIISKMEEIEIKNTFKVPLKMGPNQMAELEEVVFSDYVIEDIANTTINAAVIESRKGQLLNREGELLQTMVVDHFAENPELGNTAIQILNYFHTPGGEELLLDIADHFNSTFHGKVEVRNQENLAAAVEKHIGRIIEQLEERQKSQPVKEKSDTTEETSHAIVATLTEDPLDRAMAEYIDWARKYNKPGTQLLFKLFAAAGTTLEQYGPSLSKQQKNVILTLFGELREVVEEREDGKGRKPVRIEALVGTIIKTVQAIPSRAETRANLALEKVEAKIQALEEQIDRLRKECADVEKVRNQLTLLEKEHANLQKVIAQTAIELQSNSQNLEEATKKLPSLKPGSSEFNTTLQEVNSLNLQLQSTQISFDGLNEKNRELTRQWEELSSQIEDLESKMRQLSTLETQYNQLVNSLAQL